MSNLLSSSQRVPAAEAPSSSQHSAKLSPSPLLHAIITEDGSHLGYNTREHHDQSQHPDNGMEDADNVISLSGGGDAPETILNRRDSVLGSQAALPSSSLVYQQNSSFQHQHRYQTHLCFSSLPLGGTTNTQSQLDTRHGQSGYHNRTRSLVAQASSGSQSSNNGNFEHKNGPGNDNAKALHSDVPLKDTVNVRWNRSSLPHSNESHSSLSPSHSFVSKAKIPSSIVRIPPSMSSLICPSSQTAKPSTDISEKAGMPTSSSYYSPRGNIPYDINHFDSGIQGREIASVVYDSYDQAVGADTRSTSATDTGQRRRSTLSVVETEEDQEVSKVAMAGAAAQGGHSGIMGAGAYHASDTAAGTVITGGEDERRRGVTFTGVANEGTRSASPRPPFANNVNNTNNSISNSSSGSNSGSSRSGKSRLWHYGSHHNSLPPPTSSHQEYPPQREHSNSSLLSILPSEIYHKRTVEGTCASSFLSSPTTSPRFSAGTSDSTAPTIKPSSPPMNIHPLSFDQTDQPRHIRFHNSTNFAVGNTPSFNNKRRSLADLPFVPTKTIKTKEKRNSVSATSASSVESYRQDETIELYSGRPGHPKSGSSTSTISSVIPSSTSSRKMSLDPHSSPPTRKPSATKGVGKGAGGSTSSPKTFQCTGYPGCNMVFTRSEHLARHERKHTGEKPYKCIVPSCPRTFSRFDNMMQHTQTHGDRSKRDSLVAATGGASRSRSSSMHSTPLMAGRPRGGSSPGIFGHGYEDPLHRGLQNSPASSHMGNTVFSQQQQHHHPYSTHYQQQQSQHYPPSAPVPVSSVLMMSRSNNSIGGSVHGGGSQPYLPVSGPGSSAPVIRTLKANSRSLPHLQPRSSHGGSTDGSSVGFHGFASNETEELRRRKSEVLLPSSSYSGARAAVAGHNSSQGAGLSMSSFQPNVSHSQSLSQIDSLTPLEQDRLNEHKRTAHVLMHRMSASTGSMDQRTTFEYLDQSPAIAGHATPQGNAANRSGNVNPPFTQMHHLSASEKDQLLLEHRKSLSELYDGRYSKRSSNDPTDMVIQPLPSRDSRSGVQWFSQVGTPVNSSTGQMLSTSVGSQGGLGEGGDSVNVLPPILGRHDRYDDDAEQRHDRLPRPRSHSSNVHPLSRPSSSQFDHLGQPLWPLSDDSVARDRIHFDPTLSPRLERHLEERFYPIQKGEVLDVIDRMDTREFLGLKAQVAESFANDQFRNPEFLSNMTAILCVIRAPHPAWKNPDARRSSSDNETATSKRSLKDMDVDRVGDSERGNGSTHVDSMDVDDRQTPVKNQDHGIDRKLHNVEQPCRYALDIDVDSYGRDPEPDLRALEGLTINSLFPTKSFVAGFEPVMEKQKQSENEEANDADEDETPRSPRGYPSNARLGRFYLPERAFRTPESLAVQPDPNGPWICCQFEEYRGISIWVLESVLEKYRELARKHKMALTLVGAPVYHRIATYDHDEWEIHTGELYDVKVKESMLFPDMIQQVWKDIHRRYYQQQQQQQQQQHQHQQYQHQHHHHQQQLPLNLSSMQQQGGYQPPNQVATYEEHQKSQVRGDHSNPHGYSHPKSRSLSSAGLDYYCYSDYRHQQQSMHREDLSSAPSSPTSPPHDDFQEDSQTNESETSTPQQQDLFLNTNANMHRRISIAELCNPMQSLATERERHSQSS